MAVPPPATKADLRARALAARRAFVDGLSPARRAEAEMRLAQRLRPRLAEFSTVALYHPMRNEVDVRRLADLPHAQIAYPWFAARDAAMMFREGPATEPGPWGPLQPRNDAAVLRPEVVVVPLVIADRSGTRIGHGQGHYDRALAPLRATTPVHLFGVGWACQIAEKPIAADAWDVSLDAIITPEEWIQCR